MEVLVIELIKDAIQQLEKANIADATVDSWLLSEDILNVKKQNYYMNMGITVNEELAAKYKEAVNKRAEHIPLQHIIGYQQFLDYKILVNENVLIPRPETELLVEKVTDFIGNNEMKVLDMCTGSGCIIISLAASGHTSENGAVAIDISDDALKVADYNKKYNNADYIKLIKSDMFSSSECEQYKNEDNRFDVIVSNPPYIPTKDIDELSEEVRLHDPVLALDGDTDGLKFYKAITKQSVNYLKENGYLCYEIGYNQAEDVRNIMEQCGYSGIKVIKDLAGLDRVVIGRLNNIN